jgi:hypothetical protein
VAIVEAAAALLSDSAGWNPVDDQDCEDDSETGGYSLFCALYVAQIQTTGRYLHYRPANRVVRDVVQEYAPERILSHPLRSFNNDERTDRADVLDVLRIASGDLADMTASSGKTENEN